VSFRKLTVGKYIVRSAYIISRRYKPLQRVRRADRAPAQFGVLWTRLYRSARFAGLMEPP